VADYLQPKKPAGNGAGPEQKKQADQPETRPLERYNTRRIGAVPVDSNGCLHGVSLRK
jgi:hypothetical protein